MEYKQFVVRTFEREPGKWRAKILRPIGKPLRTGQNRVVQFITGVDRTTASAALLAALEAIDAESFSRANTLTEKLWRRRGHRSNAPKLDDRSIPAVQRANQNHVVANKKPRIRTGPSQS
jgi:hypothetical protein